MQKIGLIGLIGILCMTGCKDNTLPPQHLTNISVARNTEEAAKNTSDNTENTTGNTYSNTYINTTAPTLSRPAANTKWYIIVASYRNDERHRAEKLVKGLKAEGYPAQIIETKQRLRISIEHHSSEEKAYERRAEFLKIPGFEGTWILKSSVSPE